MSFLEFFKIYWDVTNQRYCDRSVYVPRGGKKPFAAIRIENDKHQSLMSKSARKAIILVQYLFLIAGAVLCGITGHFFFFVFSFPYFWFLSSPFMTNFSLIAIVMLYLCICRKSVYSQVLYKCFIGNFSVDKMKTEIGKKTVFVFPKTRIVGSRTIEAFTVFVKNEAKAEIYFYPRSAILKINGSKIKFKEEYETVDDLLVALGKTIKESMNQ